MRKIPQNKNIFEKLTFFRKWQKSHFLAPYLLTEQPSRKILNKFTEKFKKCKKFFVNLIVKNF